MTTRVLLITGIINLGLHLDSLAATVTWTAGGDGVSWSDTNNWSNEVLPTASDDVVIGGVGTNVTIKGLWYVTVQSLQCSASLELDGGTGGNLSLTKGASHVAGSFTMSAGGSLSVSGTNTVFVGNGPASLNDGGSLYATGGAVLSLPNLQSLRNRDATRWQANGAGSVLVLGVTNLVAEPWWYMAISAQAGGQLLLTNLLSLDGSVGVSADGTHSLVDFSGLALLPNVNGGPSFTAQNGGALNLTGLRTLRCAFALVLPFTAKGNGSLLDLSGATNIVMAQETQCSLTAQSGGKLDLGRVESIAGGATKLVSDGTGSVIDVSSLSAVATPGGMSELTTTNGGTLLLAGNVFLLANVAVNEASNPVLPPLVSPSASVSLYGRAWHSYWVEVRDTRDPVSPWQLYGRVPQTNDIQVISGPPASSQAFRVWEFVADPAILDISRAGGTEVRLVLYGAPPKNFEVQTTNNLERMVADWPVLGATGPMTNSFRAFPPFAPTEVKRFYRAKGS